MKVKDILNLLAACDPEAEVFMYEYDRGNTIEIDTVISVNKKNSPYDRNYLVEPCIQQHGQAVLICDYWANRELDYDIEEEE